MEKIHETNIYITLNIDVLLVQTWDYFEMQSVKSIQDNFVKTKHFTRITPILNNIIFVSFVVALQCVK